MDKKELFDKAEKALNQAFEAAKKSAKVVAEKAGEAAHVTKLMVEKASLEHQTTKQFARLGGCVYEKLTRDGKKLFSDDLDIQNLIEEAKRLEERLGQVEATLEQETKQKKLARRAGRS